MPGARNQSITEGVKRGERERERSPAKASRAHPYSPSYNRARDVCSNAEPRHDLSPQRGAPALGGEVDGRGWRRRWGAVVVLACAVDEGIWRLGLHVQR